MSFLALKALLRMGGTASSIMAIALLVAVISSTQSVTNHINSQSEILGRLVLPGGTYLLLSWNSSSLADSRVDAGLASRLAGLGFVRQVVPHRIFEARLENSASGRTVNVRCLDDVRGFLERIGSRINGTTPKSWAEAAVGEVLAQAYNIKLGDELELGFGVKHVKLKVVGVFRSQTSSDAELLALMETAYMLTGENGTVSFIEVILEQDVDGREDIRQVAELLPEDVRLVQTQRLRDFVQQMNAQTLTFLNVWSFAVYAVVAAASYVISTRLLTESSYELSMLRALGAGKRLASKLILAYTLTVSLLGSALGVALGTAGSQTASTIITWFLPSLRFTPFIEPLQAFQTMTLAAASSLLGCIYPALRLTRARYIEERL
jgi:ABC-type lipoprotein release transport system permease subunit